MNRKTDLTLSYWAIFILECLMIPIAITTKNETNSLLCIIITALLILIGVIVTNKYNDLYLKKE